MASHPEVAGAMSQGSTPEDRVRLLREARQLVIERHLEHGLDVPLPAAMQVTQKRGECSARQVRRVTSGAPRRINVVGLSGSGKSSVARRAADLLSVPYIELDALHWILPEWQMPPLDEFRASVDAATRGGGWVVAGNYGKVRDIVWTRADTVVWLDLPLLITIWRVAVRTIRCVRRREMLWGGNRERLSSALFGRTLCSSTTLGRFDAGGGPTPRWARGGISAGRASCDCEISAKSRSGWPASRPNLSSREAFSRRGH